MCLWLRAAVVMLEQACASTTCITFTHICTHVLDMLRSCHMLGLTAGDMAAEAHQYSATHLTYKDAEPSELEKTWQEAPAWLLHHLPIRKSFGPPVPHEKKGASEQKVRSGYYYCRQEAGERLSSYRQPPALCYLQ